MTNVHIPLNNQKSPTPPLGNEGIVVFCLFICLFLVLEMGFLCGTAIATLELALCTRYTCIHTNIHTYIQMCVCVCVCVRARAYACALWKHILFLQPIAFKIPVHLGMVFYTVKDAENAAPASSC